MRETGQAGKAAGDWEQDTLVQLLCKHTTYQCMCLQVFDCNNQHVFSNGGRKHTHFRIPQKFCLLHDSAFAPSACADDSLMVSASKSHHVSHRMCQRTFACVVSSLTRVIIVCLSSHKLSCCHVLSSAFYQFTASWLSTHTVWSFLLTRWWRHQTCNLGCQESGISFFLTQDKWCFMKKHHFPFQIFLSRAERPSRCWHIDGMNYSGSMLCKHSGAEGVTQTCFWNTKFSDLRSSVFLCHDSSCKSCVQLRVSKAVLCATRAWK